MKVDLASSVHDWNVERERFGASTFVIFPFILPNENGTNDEFFPTD